MQVSSKSSREFRSVIMHTVAFTLSPEGVVRVHDAVVCLSKFSESVSLEARHDKVTHHSPT